MTWAGTILATVGATLCLLAAVGLLRLPDALSRLQSVAKATTLGASFSVAGAVLMQPSVDAIVKAVLILGFLTLVSPISAHLVGRAAYRVGLVGDLQEDARRGARSTRRTRDGG